MKRRRILFLKENYVLRLFKNFMLAGLFVIALLLILVHKIDLGIISGISKGIFLHHGSVDTRCYAASRRLKLRLQKDIRKC